jgi:FtsP/CotA-like multicopper oxidase with cupredoxin domain
VNEAGTSTIVHWHGQLPPWKQDGFPWPETPPIPAGDTRSYDYAPIPGTFWMHSHQGMQEQSLMTAPLIVRSADDLRADRQEVVLMLHDFSFRTPDELLAGLTKSGANQNAMPNSGMEKPMNMGLGSMGAMNMGSGMTMDLNDIEYDAFLANAARSFHQLSRFHHLINSDKVFGRHKVEHRLHFTSTSPHRPCHPAQV